MVCNCILKQVIDSYSCLIVRFRLKKTDKQKYLSKHKSLNKRHWTRLQTETRNAGVQDYFKQLCTIMRSNTLGEILPVSEFVFHKGNLRENSLVDAVESATVS